MSLSRPTGPEGENNKRRGFRFFGSMSGTALLSMLLSLTGARAGEFSTDGMDAAVARDPSGVVEKITTKILDLVPQSDNQLQINEFTTFRDNLHKAIQSSDLAALQKLYSQWSGKYDAMSDAEGAGKKDIGNLLGINEVLIAAFTSLENNNQTAAVQEKIKTAATAMVQTPTNSRAVEGSLTTIRRAADNPGLTQALYESMAKQLGLPAPTNEAERAMLPIMFIYGNDQGLDVGSDVKFKKELSDAKKSMVTDANKILSALVAIEKEGFRTEGMYEKRFLETLAPVQGGGFTQALADFGISDPGQAAQIADILTRYMDSMSHVQGDQPALSQNLAAMGEILKPNPLLPSLSLEIDNFLKSLDIVSATTGSENKLILLDKLSLSVSSLSLSDEERGKIVSLISECIDSVRRDAPENQMVRDITQNLIAFNSNPSPRIVERQPIIDALNRYETWFPSVEKVVTPETAEQYKSALHASALKLAQSVVPELLQDIDLQQAFSELPGTALAYFAQPGNKNAIDAAVNDGIKYVLIGASVAVFSIIALLTIKRRNKAVAPDQSTLEIPSFNSVEEATEILDGCDLNGDDKIVQAYRALEALKYLSANNITEKRFFIQLYQSIITSDRALLAIVSEKIPHDKYHNDNMHFIEKLFDIIKNSSNPLTQ